jgi:hypothetical protein
LAGPQRDLFGSETQKGSERNDSESGDDKDNGVGLVSPMQSPGDGDEQEEDVERGVEEYILHGQQVAGTRTELMGGGEEYAEAVNRCNIWDTPLLVDKGGSEHGGGYCSASTGGGRLLRVVGSNGDILVECYDGGVGGIGWPTTRGLVVVIVGNGRVWEVGTVGGVRGIDRRVGGVYHSYTNGQGGVDKEEGETPQRSWLVLYIPPAHDSMVVALGVVAHVTPLRTPSDGSPAGLWECRIAAERGSTASQSESRYSDEVLCIQWTSPPERCDGRLNQIACFRRTPPGLDFVNGTLNVRNFWLKLLELLGRKPAPLLDIKASQKQSKSLPLSAHGHPSTPCILARNAEASVLVVAGDSMDVLLHPRSIVRCQ